MENELVFLPIRFEKNGFLYWQICRTPTAAIYEQKEKEGNNVFYEVWKVRISRSHVVNGKLFPDMERGPSNEDWGSFGWTCFSLREARKRYHLINQAESVADSYKRPGIIMAAHNPGINADPLTFRKNKPDVGPWPNGPLR